VQVALSHRPALCARASISRFIGPDTDENRVCGTDQDGLRAPFIIHATDEAHAYDGEYTIILSDWYHKRADKLNNKVRLVSFLSSEKAYSPRSSASRSL
jgi:FtsP/CotA-like multicopper oxidase with cupredoxin domain